MGLFEVQFFPRRGEDYFSLPNLILTHISDQLSRCLVEKSVKILINCVHSLKEKYFVAVNTHFLARKKLRKLASADCI